MEQELTQAVNKIHQDGALGVVAADRQGLCLAARGTGTSSAASFVSLLAQRAKSLSSTAESPVVVIEADHFNVLISQQSDVTTAIWKQA
ncbi:hypothetical protein CAOG_002515 [Capsaspora owczarzaki ATCC 30864]|uniref:Late endosomal/lysosomal adaptor and MAPK and MTOR activator 5 n=2 Tax=Capsaspora owczarzaki (strain ATCC 30864) TaxID=595528 RepID=A0A0D2VMH8_CAPO3|nr:hypothetical protein CAOG_002515 [Capsaspora owczarzaki ATCC 30864]